MNYHLLVDTPIPSNILLQLQQDDKYAYAETKCRMLDEWCNQNGIEFSRYALLYSFKNKKDAASFMLTHRSDNLEIREVQNSDYKIIKENIDCQTRYWSS